MSPRSSHLKKNRERPIKCGKRVDAFGEVQWDFAYGRDEDDESSSENESSNSDNNDLFGGDPGFIGQKRSPIDDYEVFLFGFFYFFVLQDPLINQYLNLLNGETAKSNLSVLQDLHMFNSNYLVQWV